MKAFDRRNFLRQCGCALAGGLIAGQGAGITAAWAEVINYFRIGTGAASGSFFPIGGILADVISNPPGSHDCARGGICGVPGLIAVAQSTQGSVANVEEINAGDLDSGLSQSDISFWAYRGTEIFSDRGPLDRLRVIANLFPQTFHVVVRRSSPIDSVGQLRGKRVSIDLPGSGTNVDARLILQAYGLVGDDLELSYFPAGHAADLLRDREIDAFFLVAGAPANAVTSLADEGIAKLIPLVGPEIDTLKLTYPFFESTGIRSGTYLNVPYIETLSVGAQWLVSAEVPDELVYQITRALWHENARMLLTTGHPLGGVILRDNALHGVSEPPLHPGAATYYEEHEELSKPQTSL